MPIAWQQLLHTFASPAKLDNVVTSLCAPLHTIFVRETVAFDPNLLLWNLKTVRPKSVLLWDLENVGVANLDKIKTLVPYTPAKKFAISRLFYGQYKQNLLFENGIELLDAHKYSKVDSDTKLKQVMKIFALYEEVVIVSSDSDFAYMIKELLKSSKRVLSISQYGRNKRLLMNLPLSHSNLVLKSI